VTGDLGPLANCDTTLDHDARRPRCEEDAEVEGAVCADVVVTIACPAPACPAPGDTTSWRAWLAARVT
jgi:hypothetical protein